MGWYVYKVVWYVCKVGWCVCKVGCLEGGMKYMGWVGDLEDRVVCL